MVEPATLVVALQALRHQLAALRLLRRGSESRESVSNSIRDTTALISSLEFDLQQLLQDSSSRQRARELTRIAISLNKLDSLVAQSNYDKALREVTRVLGSLAGEPISDGDDTGELPPLELRQALRSLAGDSTSDGDENQKLPPLPGEEA